jgi:hypothetical protein
MPAGATVEESDSSASHPEGRTPRRRRIRRRRGDEWIEHVFE